MLNICLIKIIRRFVSPVDDTVCGVYLVKINGKEEVIIENCGSMGIVSHIVGEKPSYCVFNITSNATEQIRKLLE